MLQHVLGLGSVGTLLAVQLYRNSGNNVRAILRSRALLQNLTASTPTPASVDKPFAIKDIAIERNGIQEVTSGIEAELVIPAGQQRGITTHPSASKKAYAEATAKAQKKVSYSPITSLFVTTKAPQVIPALQALLPRLSRDSTIVLMQNGAGLLENINEQLFPDEALRPNFIIAINNHGLFIRDWANKKTPEVTKNRFHVMWAGVGELPFGVIPNQHVQDVWRDSADTTLRQQPDLTHIPATPATESLRATVSSLLACQALQPRWLPLSELLDIQKQKVAVNAVINSLTSIFDVENGVIASSRPAGDVAYRICNEASQVYARQAILAVQPSARREDPDSLPNQQDLLRTGEFPTSHPLSSASLFERSMQVARNTGANVSSTLQDIRKGKPDLEIDFFNGYISGLGREFGIPTPVNDSVADLVRFKQDIGRQAWKGLVSSPLAPIGTNRYGLTYKPSGKGDTKQRDARRNNIRRAGLRDSKL